ncbi:bifunctional diguanylate cyclase/phosphodiesterase [Colwellia echini]|uniref:EAL domain-containing protein n=1 Tax=Colwellia echini TaxID=1982103 RepID=A0ABY3MUG4_9GAMM|nr:EAL domain-containing protein [Colwellia echini]TYK64766.1 EAL domain-containing protein [Colwellia echini]
MTVALKTGVSLRTQLYGLLIAITLITFIGSTWVSVDTTRAYLDEQMASHAQDTATSVGLSISPYMDGEDPIIVETMILAIFDSGYYQQVTLTDVDGKVIISHENNKAVSGVPTWFINFFELNPPIMSSEVNNGWNIAGVLSFQSHVGASYEKLWQHAVSNFYSSLLVALFAFLIAHFILRAVLNPLSQVEAQAIAVSKKDFTFIKKLPMTRELKAVINAMNTMVSNTQSSFDLVTKQANKLTNELFIDDLTQLGNRRAFESQFQILVNDMQTNDSATLGLVQLHSLQNINTKLGYKAGDEYVCQAAVLLTEKLKSYAGAKVYRVSGGTFFFTLNNVGEDVAALCKQINNNFSALNSNYYEDGFGKLVATTFSNGIALSGLLSSLDTLLTQEISATSNGDVYNDETLKTPRGLREWSKTIDELVATNHIEFTFQPVISSRSEIIFTDSAATDLIKHENSSINANVLYYELFSQFLNNDEVVANNQLYSMAERTNKSQELDKLVLNKLATLSNFSLNSTIAINLTHQSLHSVDFGQWLVSFIEKNKKSLPKLVFEINEEAILADITSSIRFIQLIKTLDIEVCIDRFGASFTSFKYLKGLDVDYLKIDGAYIHELDNHHENKHFIQAVTQIGHGVGIKILTSHVESIKTMQLLSELDCDGLQGNYIQKTLPLMKKDTDIGCVYSPITVI